MQLINLESVITNKAPKLRKKLPTFVIRMMERLICQKEMNDILTRLGHNDGAAFAKAMSEDMKVTYTVTSRAITCSSATIRWEPSTVYPT